MWLALLILFHTQKRYALRGGGIQCENKGLRGMGRDFLNFLHKVSLMLWCL